MIRTRVVRPSGFCDRWPYGRLTRRTVTMPIITRRTFLFAFSAAVVSSRLHAAVRPTVVVFKDPTCGCCANWVQHLRRNGFAVRATDVPDMESVKNAHNVPSALRSCHTGTVGGFVIEGHVPAADIKRLLAERPKIAGLAVPGMPVGSPGMEGPNGKPYDVVTFDAAGRSRVFSTQKPALQP
jgi:hypothetical protein